MLDQMIEGLRSFGVLECIKKHAGLLQPVFAKSSIFLVNAETFLESMQGEFSEPGSNAKEAEINITSFLLTTSRIVKVLVSCFFIKSDFRVLLLNCQEHQRKHTETAKV